MMPSAIRSRTMFEIDGWVRPVTSANSTRLISTAERITSTMRARLPGPATGASRRTTTVLSPMGLVLMLPLRRYRTCLKTRVMVEETVTQAPRRVGLVLARASRVLGEEPYYHEFIE